MSEHNTDRRSVIKGLALTGAAVVTGSSLPSQAQAMFDKDIEILDAGKAAELAQPRGHRLDLSLHADSGRANHRQLLTRMLANGLIYRRAVNHYAQRRDDSYRRDRTEIDRPCDRRRGAWGQRQTAHYTSGCLA